jgi:hypothetical protein
VREILWSPSLPERREGFIRASVPAYEVTAGAELEKAIQDEADEHERTKLDGVRGAVKTAAGMTLNAVIANAVGIGGCIEVCR